MSKPYTARSLSSAQRRARYLRRELDKAHELISQFHKERVDLAKLAAKGPCFFNPLEAFAAEKIRDEILLKHAGWRVCEGVEMKNYSNGRPISPIRPTNNGMRWQPGDRCRIAIRVESGEYVDLAGIITECGDRLRARVTEADPVWFGVERSYGITKGGRR